MRNPRTVLITRPAERARVWVQQLAAHGHDARALPLIRIEPEPMRGRLRGIRSNLPGWPVIMFVSGNAVRHFLRPLAGEAAGWLQGQSQSRAWAPGPGTRAALLASGWPPDRIDAPLESDSQYDSESLWQRVSAQVQPGRRVLIVRGADASGRIAGRQWLAERIRAAGGEVVEVAAYRRMPPVWGEHEHELATRLGERALWLFSSSRAIANLRLMAPGRDWSAAAALTTHPRIAEAARSAGFGTVDEVRPSLTDVLAWLKL